MKDSLLRNDSCRLLGKPWNVFFRKITKIGIFIIGRIHQASKVVTVALFSYYATTATLEESSNAEVEKMGIFGQLGSVTHALLKTPLPHGVRSITVRSQKTSSRNFGSS